MRKRKFFPRGIVSSIKNVVISAIGITGTAQAVIIAKAVTSPSPTVTSDCSHGSIIKAIYLMIDGCGLGGTGVQNNIDFFLWKNPGANLSFPSPRSVGSSNEKKFVFRQWHFMAMRNQDGNVPFHWEGWVRIPKRYQRMGTDDLLEIIVTTTTALTGHFSFTAIYKWYR